MAVSRNIYVSDGVSKAFTVSTSIDSKSNVKVYYTVGEVDNVLLDNEYDILENIVITKEPIISGATVTILVSSDGSGLELPPSKLDEIYDSIDNINITAQHINNVDVVADNIEPTNNVGSYIQDVINTSTIKDDIVTVSADRENIIIVASDIDTTKESNSGDYGSITEQVTGYGGSSIIDTVADKIQDVTTNSTNMQHIVTNSNNINNIIGVDNNKNNIDNVADNKDNIDTVVSMQGKIDTILDNIDDINSLADNNNDLTINLGGL